jgi:hypothetical protein
MRRIAQVAVAIVLALGVVGVVDLRAQQPAEPVTRYVAVTTFDVPYGDREKVLSWMDEYFFPFMQLNPRIKNFRMLSHAWGSDGAQIVMVGEYESFADIDADCGPPCEAYEAEHPVPEEGAAGYEEYSEKLELFNKHYSKHRDEIYATNMRRAVVEGVRQGPVGPQPAQN